jgi:ribosomal-protein-alanine N-acetyltransferase
VGSTDLILSAASSSLQFDQLYTKRFFLKPIELNDVGNCYLNWLNNPQDNEFIHSANADITIEILKEYVMCRINRKEILFLGIFDRNSGLHIGNIKYEPINFLESYAIMGILIGNKSWRGQGVAFEVLHATAKWLKESLGIKKIILGVDRKNVSAISVYKKIGFIGEDTFLTSQLNDSDISMTWKLEEVNFNDSQA